MPPVVESKLQSSSQPAVDSATSLQVLASRCCSLPLPARPALLARASWTELPPHYWPSVAALHTRADRTTRLNWIICIRGKYKHIEKYNHIEKYKYIEKYKIT